MEIVCAALSAHLPPVEAAASSAEPNKTSKQQTCTTLTNVAASVLAKVLCGARNCRFDILRAANYLLLFLHRWGRECGRIRFPLNVLYTFGAQYQAYGLGQSRPRRATPMCTCLLTQTLRHPSQPNGQPLAAFCQSLVSVHGFPSIRGVTTTHECRRIYARGRTRGRTPRSHA